MRLTIVLLAMFLGGCASTELRRYVGRDISEVMMSYGHPEQVIDLPDGRRGWQYRWGGGRGVIPGRAQTTVQAIGNTAVATTNVTPATVFESKGCLITFIATRSGNSWTVAETRTPKQLVC